MIRRTLSKTELAYRQEVLAWEEAQAYGLSFPKPLTLRHGPVVPADHVALGMTQGDDPQPVFTSYTSRLAGTYLIGKPGRGKSTVIERLVAFDMAYAANEPHRKVGLCLLDPHGDLTKEVLARVPPSRTEDVVLLDVLDYQWPFSLDPFHCPDPTGQLVLERTVDQAMHVFKKLWGPGSEGESWGPRLEDLLRVAAFTLAELPELTMVDLEFLLTDPEFRARVVARISDPFVRHFWEHEFPRGEKDAADYRSSLMNKVRAFTWRRTIRNIVGQSNPRKRLSFREFMDEGKIVLVPMPAVQVGYDVAALLGAMIVGEILTAALSRGDIPEAERRTFCLYADEFQYYASNDFAALLEQARKYRVPTLIAHQHRGQLDGRNLAATLIAENLLVMGVTGKDAAELAPEFDNRPPPGDAVFKPVMFPSGGLWEQLKVDHGSRFHSELSTLYAVEEGPRRTYADVTAGTANDLTNQPPYQLRAKLRQGNEIREYTLATLKDEAPDPGSSEVAERIEYIGARTRATYCRPRADVEREIFGRLPVGRQPWGGDGGDEGAWAPPSPAKAAGPGARRKRDRIS
jgi:hypothetical protein